MMDRLVNLKMAEYKDSGSIPALQEKGIQVLRIYTKEQIELYLRTLTLNKDFELPIDTPKQVRVKPNELDKIIKPQFKPVSKKRLF